MTRTTRHHIATVGILLLAASLALSAAGVAGASAGAIPSGKLGEQPGQAQSGANTTPQNASSANATVEFSNQTVNGSTVTVKRVTLPTSGFIALDSTGPGEEGFLEESTIAVSQRLSAGTHRNVTLRINQSPPGGVANQTTLNSTGTYEAVLYRDSNNNSHFEFITSGRSTDRPLIVGSGSNARLALDSARIIVRGSRGDPNATPTPTASVQFADQRTNGSAVTVRSVTLPQGGFVIVHNESYLRGGDPTQTAIGLSGYLSAGTHQNVSVALVNGSVQQSQTLVAVPAQDTDNNQTYDYVRSDGFRDVPYTAENGAVTDRAAVTVASSATPIASPSQPTSAVTTDTPHPTMASTGTSRPATGEAGSEGGATQWLTANWVIVLVVIVVVGGYLLIRRS
jgi:hypothetical protein